jgi:hypothetical protein
MLIINNFIKTSVEDGDGFHRDGMQGQPCCEMLTPDNIEIAHNVIIRDADPTNMFPGELQGIDTFDGSWTNLYIHDNIVMVNDPQGISFYGVTHLKLYRNVLLKDNGRYLPCANLQITDCLTKTIVTTSPYQPGLVVTKSKLSVPSDDVDIEDNFVPGLQVTPETTNIIVKNNSCSLTTFPKCVFGFPINGVVKWVGLAGTYGDNNVIAK